MKRLLLSLLIVLTALGTGFGQKYGHVNFGNLLALMPGTEKAQTDLEAFQQAELAKLEATAKQLREDFEKTAADRENIPPVRLRELEAEFQRRQEDLLARERKLSQDIEVKRQELLGPLVQEARDAIKKVADEQGYEMVFDSSLFNALLFTEESTDMLPAVKAVLGIE